MKSAIQWVLNIFRFHKLKIVVVILSFLVCSLLRFPLDDLSGVMSAQITEATQGQVFLQFEKLGLAFFPQPSLSFTDVLIDTPVISNLHSKRLKLSPSIPALLTFRMGFVADASEILGGDTDFSLREGEKTKEGARKYQIALNAEHLNLAEIKKALDLPVPLKGAVNAKLSGNVDPSFIDQPEGDVQMTFASLEVPASSVPTPFGPMNLPTVKWSNVVLKGRMAQGKFFVDEGKVGAAQDPLNGQIKGQMDVRILRSGNADVSSYDFRVELNLNKSVEKDFGLFLSFLDTFRTPNLSGSKYLFRATGLRFGVPPRLSALASFN